MNNKEKLPFVFDNTFSVKELSKMIDEKVPDWSFTLSGNDKLLFNKGDKVVSTSSSPIKPGIELVVEDVDIVCGWARYYAGGVWHRQHDLVKA